MTIMIRTRLCVLAVMVMSLGLGGIVLADTVIDKSPDLGPFWNPLRNGSTYVYAGSFIAPEGESAVTHLGMWLEPTGGSPFSVISMQIWGGGDGGPDCNDVIAMTDDFTGPTPGLNLYVMDVTDGLARLIEGERYWFAATGAHRGDINNSSYRVGAHTQNSVYNDDGTFWYANDENGCAFDGQNLTPEMAFQVHLAGANCTYTIKKSKAKKRCRTCPAKGDDITTASTCEVVKDCKKKIVTTIACPDGPGACKVKAKRSDCS